MLLVHDFLVLEVFVEALGFDIIRSEQEPGASRCYRLRAIRVGCVSGFPLSVHSSSFIDSKEEEESSIFTLLIRVHRLTATGLWPGHHLWLKTPGSFGENGRPDRRLNSFRCGRPDRRPLTSFTHHHQLFCC